MRAHEFQKPYLSATNNGTTLAVLPSGAVQAQLAKNTQGALNVTVQGMAGQTPYSIAGDWFAVGLALLVLGLSWLRRENR
jgi:apolipoprotein N-acyltransferase